MQQNKTHFSFSASIKIKNEAEWQQLFSLWNLIFIHILSFIWKVDDCYKDVHHLDQAEHKIHQASVICKTVKALSTRWRWVCHFQSLLSRTPARTFKSILWLWWENKSNLESHWASKVANQQSNTDKVRESEKRDLNWF